MDQTMSSRAFVLLLSVIAFAIGFWAVGGGVGVGFVAAAFTAVVMGIYESGENGARLVVLAAAVIAWAEVAYGPISLVAWVVRLF